MNKIVIEKPDNQLLNSCNICGAEDVLHVKVGGNDNGYGGVLLPLCTQCRKELIIKLLKTV